MRALNRVSIFIPNLIARRRGIGNKVGRVDVWAGSAAGGSWACALYQRVLVAHVFYEVIDTILVSDAASGKVLIAEVAEQAEQ